MPKLLQFLKNKTIYIARLTNVSGDKFLASTVTNCQAHIQPLEREKVNLVNGVFGKTYIIYTDSCVDIQQGDKLRDSDSVYYKVIDGGVSKRDFGSFDHCEVLVEKIN